MFQVAYGGHLLSGEQNYESDLDFREAGFGSDSFPIEFDISKSDRIFFLLRKRSSIYGDSFVEIDYENIVIEAKDLTSGISIPSAVYIENVVNAEWTDTSFDSILFSIDSNINFQDLEDNPNIFIDRVKAIEIYIKDTSDNNFISFRVYIDDNEMKFYYIIVPEKDIERRDVKSNSINNPYIDINNLNNFHILISPSSRIREIDDNYYSFSYPYSTIFYKRDRTFNDEEYVFDINGEIDTLIYENISIFPIPGYHRVGVLKVDSYLKNKMIKKNVRESSLNISVTGKITNKTYIFPITFFV